MLKTQFIGYFALTTVMSLLFIKSNTLGYDINDKFSVGGVLAGAYQYQEVDGDKDQSRGTLPFQPELSFRPTEKGFRQQPGKVLSATDETLKSHSRDHHIRYFYFRSSISSFIIDMTLPPVSRAIWCASSTILAAWL